MLVVDPESAIDDVRLNHVFCIQEDCVLTLGDIEDQLMRSWVKQAWRANVIADTESKVTALREKVIIALNTRGIARNTRDIAALRQTVEHIVTSGTSAVFGNLLPPPAFHNSFLVGRRRGASCSAYWSVMGVLLLLSTGAQAKRN